MYSAMQQRAKNLQFKHGKLRYETQRSHEPKDAFLRTPR